MASVSLDTVYLSLASDLSQVVILEVAELVDTDAVEGDVRKYANGRRRSVTRSGTSRTIPLNPDWVEPDDVETLRSWRGKTVLFRDSYGRKVYGVFYAVQVSEQLHQAVAAAVSLTLTQLTVSEVA